MPDRVRDNRRLLLNADADSTAPPPRDNESKHGSDMSEENAGADEKHNEAADDFGGVQGTTVVGAAEDANVATLQAASIARSKNFANTEREFDEEEDDSCSSSREETESPDEQQPSSSDGEPAKCVSEAARQVLYDLAHTST